MNSNPFNFSRPVKGEDFYNREKDIETAIGFIKGSQCFSVIGERRIGKTSFLQHILSEEMLKKHEVDTEKYIVVYLSVGSILNISKDRFIEKIVEKVEERTEIEIESENIFEKFEKYIEALDKKGIVLIMALDEFETISSILDYHFSYWLRSIFEKENVIAITASRVTIREISEEGMASPLFNIFGSVFLGFFSRNDTESMIKKMFEKGSIYLGQDEISFLADLSGGNPYFVQYLGYYFYDEKKNKKKEKVNHNDFERKMLDHLNPQFEDYWKYLAEEEKKYLLDPKNVDNSIEYILKRKGFLIEEKRALKVFSKLFKEFLEKKSENILKREKSPFIFMSIYAVIMSLILFLSVFAHLSSRTIKFILIFVIMLTPILYFLERRFS